MKELHELLDEETDADRRDIGRIVELDFRFHLLVAIASGNILYPLLLNSFREVYTNLTRQFFEDDSVVDLVFRSHRELYGAIRDRNARKAVAVMKRLSATGSAISGRWSKIRLNKEVGMESAAQKSEYAIKQPKGLSPRIQWLRDYYFRGVERELNNESTSWTTGAPWDAQYNELTFYIVPETYALLQTISGSYKMAAKPVALPEGFWTWRIPERRAWFNREVMVNTCRTRCCRAILSRRGAV